MSTHRQNHTPPPSQNPATEEAAGWLLGFVVALLLVMAGLHSLGALFL
jgi:hypothetical protein